jgi:hypothetical protein
MKTLDRNKTRCVLQTILPGSSNLAKSSWAKSLVSSAFLLANCFNIERFSEGWADERKHEFPACPLRWVKGGARNQLQNKRTTKK